MLLPVAWHEVERIFDFDVDLIHERSIAFSPPTPPKTPHRHAVIW
jgi:hypothetical protein